MEEEEEEEEGAVEHHVSWMVSSIYVYSRTFISLICTQTAFEKQTKNKLRKP